MPFRPIHLEVTYGEPQLLVRAGPGDIYLQVSCTTFGAKGVSGGPNYVVGVKQDGVFSGLFISGNVYETGLSDGDELWVAAAEELDFTSVVLITGLIRYGSREGGQGDAQGDGRGG